MKTRFWRWHGNALVLLASVGLAIGLCTGCASAPPSEDRPQIGCAFDSQMRFRYALVIERDDVVARWVTRQMMTMVRDPYDPDVHVSPSVRVRAGYCPDESQSVTSSRAPNAFVPRRP